MSYSIESLTELLIIQRSADVVLYVLYVFLQYRTVLVTMDPWKVE